MVENRIKTKDIATIKSQLARQQGYECAICQIDLMQMKPINWVLDHCHDEGHIRGVLCRNCNGMEGKVKTYATRAKRDKDYLEWLEQMINYVRKNRIIGKGNRPIHPLHKTDDEKRERRNMLARKRRAAKKVQG